MKTKGNVFFKALTYDLALHSAMDFSWLCSFGFLAAWYSGKVVELHRDLVVVAFLWFRVIQTNLQHLTSSKHQRLTS